MIYVLLGLLVLLATLLLSPVGVELDYSERGRKWYAVWLGLHIPVSSFAKRVMNLLKDDDGEEKIRRYEDTKKQRADEAEEGRAIPKLGELVETMTSNLHAFERGLDVIRSISHHIRIHVHRLDVVVATPNPALTGFAYGMTQAFGFAFAPNIPWTAEVDFMREQPSLSFRVEVSVTPIKVLPPALRLLRFVTKRKISQLRRRRKLRSSA